MLGRMGGDEHIAEPSLHFVLKMHVLYCICFSPTSCSGNKSEKSSENAR